MEPSRPPRSFTYDYDKLIEYEHVPSSFLTHFHGLLETIVCLLIISNLALGGINLYLDNVEFIIIFNVVIISCCAHFINYEEVNSEKTGYDGDYFLSALVLTVPFVLVVVYVIFLPPQDIVTLLSMTFLLMQLLSSFILTYIKAHYWCSAVNPFAPLKHLILEESGIYEDGPVQVIRSRAHEVLLLNTTDKNIDLSLGTIQKWTRFHYNWKIRLPEGTTIQAKSYLQIVPWNRADESLCRIGLRNTQHVFLPTVKKSFLRSREDFTDTTLTTTNGDRSVLSEAWRNLKTE